MNRNTINNLDYGDPNDVALLCSYLCTISYLDNTDQEKWLADRFKFDYFQSSSVKNLQYFIMFDDNNKNAFFVIRGTDIKRFRDEWRDLRISLRFWGKKVKNTKAHNGYVRAGNNLINILHEKMAEAQSNGYKVILTGHSLGGVLAKYIACTLDLKSQVYTFGSPCLAKSDFYDDVMNVSVYKYRMEGDLIPLFPSLLFEDIFGEEFLLHRGNVSADTEIKRGFFTPLMFLTKAQIFYKLYHGVKSHNITVYNLNLLRHFKNKTIKK